MCALEPNHLQHRLLWPKHCASTNGSHLYAGHGNCYQKVLAVVDTEGRQIRNKLQQNKMAGDSRLH